MHQVGAGVLGPVFRAYDPDTERTVALKSFPLDLTPEQAGRLGASFARLATLDLTHPSLIVPIAAGSEGSTAYLVEEYFVADSVDIAVRQYGPAPVPDALRLVGQLAGGLDFAAAAGVHHGALHPRDVLVAPRDVRLTGIGVAQALEEVGFRLQPRRPYSAPERSERAQWGAAADVYSLAALAYELLTGRRPAMSGDTATIDPQAVPASDAAALEEVFARAFSAGPGDRFPSALAFAAALKHALTGHPIDAPGDAERPRGRRPGRGARKGAMLPLEEPATPAPAGVPDAIPSPAEPERPLATSEPHPAEPPPSAAVAVFEPPPPLRIEEAAAPTVEPVIATEGAGPPELPGPIVIEPPSSPEPPQPSAEPTATLLPAETSEVREALLAGEPELPAPPPALDDLDLRPRESEPSVLHANEPYESGSEPPARDEPRFADLEVSGPPAPAPRFQEPPPAAPAADRGRPRSFDDSPPAARLTPAYHPAAPPRRSSPAATVLVVILMGVALAVAGGYYAASRYLGREAEAPEQATPAAGTEGSSGAATQGQAPAPSPETVPPEPSLPVREPGGQGVQPGSAPPSGAVSPPASHAPAPAPAAGQTGGVSPRPPKTTARPPTPAGKTPPTATGKRTEAAARPDTARVPSRAPNARTTTSRAAAPTARRPASTVFEGSLSIASRPSGARVFLDGHPVGTTPMTLSKISAGSHVVRLQSDGYAMWSGGIQVTAGELNRVTASLDRLPR